MQKEFLSFKSQFDNIKNPNCDYDEQDKQLNETEAKIKVVYNFWSDFTSFNTLVKELNKRKISDIQFKPYEEIVRSSMKVITQFEELKIETN